MGRKKKPGKEAFKEDLKKFSQSIPYYYSNEVKQILKKPDLDSVYIQNVRKGHILDWDVLEALKSLAAKNQPKETVAA